MIEEIVHVGVSVVDLEKSVRFYTEVLGMQIDYRAHHKGEQVSRVVGVRDAELDICVVKLGAVRLELIDYGRARNAPVEYKDQSTPGLIHIALRVSNVDEIYERLKALGYGSNSEPMVTRDNGPKICYFRGPDNVIMELYEVPEKS